MSRSACTAGAGDALVGLGAGIALGSVLTHWNTATDFLFLLAGAIVAVQGVSLSRRAALRGREDALRGR